MKQNKIVLLFLAIGLLITGAGCKKYLYVNQNVNDPVKVPVSTLLTGCELAIGRSLSMGNGNAGGLSGGLSVYMHQQSTREQADAYGMLSNDFDIETAWPALYASIADLDRMIIQATAETRFVYAGIGKILKAYAFSQMVDVWGDIPFSEYNSFKNGVKQPKFDDDATIYPKLFTLLDEGITAINNPAVNASVPGNDDLIYRGNKARWIKAANTIKLKLYTQVRKVQNVTPQVTALLASPSTLISAAADMFIVPCGPLGATDDRNVAFTEYFATQRTQHVSPWFYEIMRGYNPNINTGVVDPRIPYYIYNQLRANVPSGSGATEYRDGAFISIYFGSVGTNRDRSQQNSISLFGIYPIGGRYDDGLGGTAVTSSGTGAAPYRLITYADRLYLEAELINTGVIAGDAKAVFSAAMSASMAQVDYVIATYVKPTQTVSTLGVQTAYINSILALYDAGSTAKKLEYIMTQKWLSSVGSSVDQYTDYRRTGYPVLFSPRNPAMAPGGFVQPPVNGNPFQIPQLAVPVQQGTDFPLSLPWSQIESALNGNAPAPKTPGTYKVFWMP